jgi:hypothetical protein
MRLLMSRLFIEKPKELLPLPTSQRLQERLHQSLDLGLTVFLAARLAHFCLWALPSITAS